MGSKDETSNVEVLYVDDEPDSLDLAKAFLEGEHDDLTVHPFDSARTALDSLDETDYDAVVSEYRLPEMDGLELLEAVRSDHDDVPFVMFTGHGHETVAMEALNLGADRYLRKDGDSKSEYGRLGRVIRQEVERGRAETARRESEKRYRSLFENNPLVIWVEDFSEIKARLDDVATDVEDMEAYLEENPDVLQGHLESLDIIDVNENALDYYGAESKREILDNVEELFTEESYEANKSMVANMAMGETHFRTESVTNTLADERKHEIMEANVPEEYADDYSRVYIAVTEVTDRVEAQRREALLHSVMRHDVRNKEQLVRGYLEQLHERDLPDEASEYVRRALETVDESVAILDKVGALVKAENDEEATEAVRLRSVLESVAEQFEAQAAEQDVALEVTGDAPAVSAGPLVEELFRNLVGNALQHADATVVRLAVRESDARTQVTVTDDGDGIPDDRKDRIFEPQYKRGENAGAGLGLHLASKIAETYGWEIDVSDSELGGARFDVLVR